ncbi:hypothetical protein EGW08_001909 [Elysia chlorotica]|uniref:2-C-methyl-D-erythritol 4-phosphate cytidylyltransferase, chloroplastic n=1 Tax=Elysia chlorotica TaxID=188477 RepID=A0A3S1AFA8_ELYCH|nr:hypothetical protein EGW08_001909 [Elysia chlorotica]
MRADVILPAAGSSVRMKLPIAKQFQEICGHPILAYTIDCFHRLPWIRNIVVVVEASQVDHTRCLVDKYKFDRVIICTGGSTRHRSICCGVQALQDVCQSSDVVLIHDGARPFVPEHTIMEVASAAVVNKAAGVTRPLVSTVIRGDAHGTLVESLDRLIYQNSEMPQAFQYSVIAEAYSKCTDYDFDYGTECLLLALKFADCPAQLVQGTDDLWKVTYQKDLYAMESIVKEKFSRLCIINTCRRGSTFVSELEKNISGWPFKLASTEESLANTLIVLVDSWSHTPQNSPDLESIASSIADKCGGVAPDTRISLVPIVLIVFVPAECDHTLISVTGGNQTDHQAVKDDVVSHMRKEEDLNKKQNDHGCSRDETRTGCSTSGGNSTSSPSTISSSGVESCLFEKEKRMKFPSSSACTESLETNGGGGDFTGKNVVCSESSGANSVPTRVHKVRSMDTQRHDACAYVLASLKSLLENSSAERPFIVAGIMTEDHQEFPDKLRDLVWHRASYLDGQLLDWT